jgi:hypothetical protein
LITHARTGRARFLGYEITVQQAEHKLVGGRRSVNGVIALRVPMSVVEDRHVRHRDRRQRLLQEFPHQAVFEGRAGAAHRDRDQLP